MKNQWDITARTSVVGVIGDPVRHSLSPIIHNVGFRSLGVDWVYVAFEVSVGNTEKSVVALRTLNLRGLSVTMPHKTEMAKLVDRCSEAAVALRSVNTVEVASDGALVGHSTDGDGLIRNLQAHEVQLQNARVLLLGAGGAGRSVVDALARHGCSQVTVANRSLSAAEYAVAFAPKGSLAIALHDDPAMRRASEQCDLIIHATSIGMGDTGFESNLPISKELLKPRHTVVDLVYHPIRTHLLRAAQENGCQIVDGLGMLVHQAALQQEIWTGYLPDVHAMLSAATQALS
ncbi:MAG: shikimate dehydrogenase [Actinomycetes bacterium]